MIIMLEFIVFGVTLTVSMVVASLVVFTITMKLMCSKRFWKKFMTQYMIAVNDLTAELTGEDQES